jgi:reactive intermediate/imine deaminase
MIAVAAVVLAPAVVVAQAPQFITTNPQSTAPFSPAVKVGNMLYLAGQEGTDHGKLVPGGIGPETKQTLTNIKTLLEANGSDMEHVVKCTIFLADIKEWGAMNEVYRTFFSPGKLPARSAFGASGLAQDARTEIECIAVVK